MPVSEDDDAHREEVEEAKGLDAADAREQVGGQNVGRGADQGHIAAEQRRKSQRHEQFGEGRCAVRGRWQMHRGHQDCHGADIVHEGRHEAGREHQ